MRRVRVFVSGRVQGVFFRQSVAREARSRNVTGFARNLSDGRVEAVFQGSDEAVARLIEWVRSGPPGARVDATEVLDESPVSEETAFETR